LFNQRLYGGLRVEGLYDKIADVDYRFTISPLLGYYIIKDPATSLAVEAGPSLVLERVGSEDSTYLGGRVGERFEHKFKSGAKIWETAEWITQVDDVENWILNAEAGVSAPIVKALDVRIVVQNSYDNQPAPGRLKNDFKLIAGLGYRF
jgi:putative salt-induced outer membrane protein YdiY